jgi:hypothetical protein
VADKVWWGGAISSLSSPPTQTTRRSLVLGEEEEEEEAGAWGGGKQVVRGDKFPHPTSLRFVRIPQQLSSASAPHMTGFSTWEAGIIIEYLSFTYPLFFLKLSSYWNWTALVGTWNLTFKLLQLDITSSWEPCKLLELGNTGWNLEPTFQVTPTG